VIKFMVLSAPRSASTWVANWLTTEKTLCLHDPVLEHRVEALDHLPCDRMLGVSCTGMALLTKFVNAHPAKKVVLHRDLREVNQSLYAIGLTKVGPAWDKALAKVDGAMHVQYADVFDPDCAKAIWEYLTGLPFDEPRHQLLRNMHVEPNFVKVKVVPERAREFRQRIEEALK
jgi:hypothetical protein